MIFSRRQLLPTCAQSHVMCHTVEVNAAGNQSQPQSAVHGGVHLHPYLGRRNLVIVRLALWTPKLQFVRTATPNEPVSIRIRVQSR